VPPPQHRLGSLFDVLSPDRLYRTNSAAFRQTNASIVFHAKSCGGKWNQPDCAPRLRGEYQPFDTSLARAGGGVNGRSLG
jgi:hypothetical protein